ncbi:MAG: hypothetical protein ACI9LO_001312 [Planctomycetota bacterium]|jgi:hypothetical protein
MLMTGKMAGLQRLSLILLLTTSFFANAQSTTGNDNKNWTPDSLDLRILELRVKQYTFDDVVAGYQFEDIVLLPLGAISEIIDLAIDVGEQSASGFVINQNRTLFLDIPRNEITLQGVLKKYDPDKVHVLFNDIYVESNLLGDWLNMTFDVDLFAARVWIQSEEPLPFQQQLERDKRIALAMGRLNQDQVQYPRHVEPYQNWSMPFVDQTFRLSHRKNDQGDSVSNYQYTTYATADLAKLESSLFFSGSDENESDQFRINFGRKDPQGGLLGKLDATEFSFGHMAEPRLALINQPSSLEAGVSASSFPLGRQIEFDRHRFIGELLPDWEVELYRNNALIGYQGEPINGQYDFQDVPLLFGNNHFRLVFYGPQGQIREEENRFDLNQSLTRAGEYYYRVTATNDDAGGSRAILQFDAGMNKRLSATANLASIPLEISGERKQHDYLNLGLRSYWDKFFVTFDTISDLGGGDAYEINLQTRWNSTIFGVTETVLDNFFSEEFGPNEVELSRRSSWRVDSSIPPGLLPRIPIGFEFKRDVFADGGELNSIINRISTNAHGIAISNQLVRQKISGQDATSTGTLQLSGNYSGTRWRGTVNYAIDPHSELSSLALTADPGRFGEYRVTLGLTHSLEQGLTEYGVSASKGSGRYNLGYGLRYNSDDEIALDASLSISFGHEPRSRQWFSNARTMAGSGSISARAFLDSNQDSVFNEGDEALPDVGFRLNGGYNSIRTDDDGVGFLTGLPVHQPLNLTVAPETITDPLWIVAREGIGVVPRPGHTMQLDFPILITGEIDGTVYLAKDGRQFGVGRVIVELLDVDRNIVSTAVTAYDGFYVMSKIPFGQYHLRVSKKQQDELELVSNKVESFSINAQDYFLNGFDFVLRENKP